MRVASVETTPSGPTVQDRPPSRTLQEERSFTDKCMGVGSSLLVETHRSTQIQTRVEALLGPG